MIELYDFTRSARMKNSFKRLKDLPNLKDICLMNHDCIKNTVVSLFFITGMAGSADMWETDWTANLLPDHQAFECHRLPARNENDGKSLISFGYQCP